MSTQPSQETKSNRFYTVLRNIFLVLLIVQFAPMVISSIKKNLVESISPKSQVGYLKVEGFIVDSTYYTKRLQEFAKNDAIKALLLKIDSPGGVPSATQAIFNELKKFKAKKPVVVLVENVCASAAYYIACSANKIITAPSSVIGSIGVFMRLPNFKGLADQWQVKMHYVQSGKYKTVGNPLGTFTAEDRAYLQHLTDDTYDQFLHDVAQTRGLSLADKATWADGKVFTGRQALKLNLIDQLGSISDATEVIKGLTGIKDDVKFVSLKKPVGGLMRLITGGEEDYESETEAFSDVAANFMSSVCSKVVEQQAAKSNALTMN